MSLKQGRFPQPLATVRGCRFQNSQFPFSSRPAFATHNAEQLAFSCLVFTVCATTFQDPNVLLAAEQFLMALPASHLSSPLLWVSFPYWSGDGNADLKDPYACSSPELAAAHCRGLCRGPVAGNLPVSVLIRSFNQAFTMHVFSLSLSSLTSDPH